MPGLSLGDGPGLSFFEMGKDLFKKDDDLGLAFSEMMCYHMLVFRDRIFPGVAKFGIALEWGSRGLEFESRHSDQIRQVSKETCRIFLHVSMVGR